MNTLVPKDTRRLYQTTRFLVAGLIAFILYKGWDHLPPEQLSLCVISALLAVWPALRWLKNQPYQLPAFETFMLTAITAYVLPVATDHAGLDLYEPAVVTKAAFGVVLFQLSALFAFFQYQAWDRKSPFWTEALFTRDISTWLPIGLWLNLIYIILSHFLLDIPGDIDSILRAVFFGINTACTFLLGRSWREGNLQAAQKVSVGLAILFQGIILMASLYLITALSAFLVFMLAFVSAGRKIPIVTLVLVFVVLSILHNGKAVMRLKYWDIDAPIKIELGDLPAFYTEWFENGLKPVSTDEPDAPNRQLLERTSLIHMLCLVIEHNQRGLPYLYGETYTHILPQLVPRFFWPGKPTGQVTKRKLAIYYGLQDEHAAKTTSIAFGQLAEAFANFGFLGLVLLGLFFGWANKLIATWTSSAPLISNGGFTMILLMAWSLQIELPMSSWIASFYQASLCVLGLPYVLRRMLG